MVLIAELLSSNVWRSRPGCARICVARAAESQPRAAVPHGLPEVHGSRLICGAGISPAAGHAGGTPAPQVELGDDRCVASLRRPARLSWSDLLLRGRRAESTSRLQQQVFTRRRHLGGGPLAAVIDPVGYGAIEKKTFRLPPIDQRSTRVRIERQRREKRGNKLSSRSGSLLRSRSKQFSIAAHELRQRHHFRRKRRLTSSNAGPRRSTSSSVL